MQVSAVLLGALLATSVPAWAYLWEVTTTMQASPPGNLRVTAIYMPSTMKIEWQPGYSGNSNQRYLVERGVGGVFTSLGQTTNTYWVDRYDFTFGETYEYRVMDLGGESAPSMGLPGPPPGANPEDIFNRTEWTQSVWTTIPVVPIKVDANENQTVDSRYDLRYGNPTLLDYQFKTKTYRGGLFAGYASDPARTGRSFLKFVFDPVPTGYNVWASSLNAYWTRSFAYGSTTVGCQAIANDSWSATTLKWSTAPAVTPSAANHRITLTYSEGGGGVWQRWPMHGAICDTLLSDRTLTAALTSTSESTAGWAYFAKKEFNAEQAPCVLYALRAPVQVAELVLNPSYVTGGQGSTGTVTLNGPAPTGGAQVLLDSADTAVAQVPLTVTVPAGQYTATFAVTTSAVMCSTEVGISASHGGNSSFFLLGVSP